MFFRLFSWRIVLCFLFALIGTTAPADESLFGYLYTTDTMPQGHWEYEQWNTLRTGKEQGNYWSFDLRNEFEYGVTNDFSAAFYINSSYIFTDNVYNPENVSMNL